MNNPSLTCILPASLDSTSGISCNNNQIVGVNDMIGISYYIIAIGTPSTTTSNNNNIIIIIVANPFYFFNFFLKRSGCIRAITRETRLKGLLAALMHFLRDRSGCRAGRLRQNRYF